MLTREQIEEIQMERREKGISIKNLLKEKGIRTIALNRNFYMDPEDARDYEILKCIRDKTVYNPDEGAQYGRYFLKIEEYDEYHEREDILNSDVLASLCNVNLDFHSSLPEYKCPKDIKSAEYLRLLSKEGLKRRLKGIQTRNGSKSIR